MPSWLRGKMAGSAESAIGGVARLAKNAGLSKLKLYVIIGLPDEERSDIDELIEFIKELFDNARRLGVSPLPQTPHSPGGCRFCRHPND